MTRFPAMPDGMSRRHFMSHMAGAAALAAPAIDFTNTLLANAQDMRKKHKAAIMLWMGGGPSTIDIWDLKPGAPTGGQFKPIATSADGVQICEHMPLMAKQMHHMAIVRSLSTREADHMRGRYYMHTGYVPNPNVEHPSYGSVIAHELADQVPGLEIPPFVSVGGGSVGPGFLGMTWAPFVVDSNGNVRNLDMGIDKARLEQRLAMLGTVEGRFIAEKRGGAPGHDVPVRPPSPSPQAAQPHSDKPAIPVQGEVPYSPESLTTLLQGCVEPEACAKRLRRQLATDGYLNSQVLTSESPPSLQVRLGRLEALTVTGPSGWVNRRVRRLLGALLHQPLRLPVLKRQLRLLQLQPGLRTEAASLTSIANDPFRAQLSLKMVPTAQPVRGVFSLRNDGTSGSGEYRSTGVLLKNALALPGDTLLLFGEVDGTDSPELGMVIGSLSYTLPLTDTLGLTGSFGYNRRSQVELPSPDDLFANQQYQGQLLLEWTFLERMLQRWSLSAAITRSANTNSFDGEPLPSFFPSLVSNPRSGYLRFALNGSGLSGPLAWYGNAYLLQGVDSMTPEDQRQALARFDIVPGQATAIGGLASASWDLAPACQLQLSGGGQVAFNPLTSPMQFTLGSDVGIRGLPAQLVSGNSGWLATSELEWTFWRKGRQALQLVPFLGAGGVYFHTTSSRSTSFGTASDTLGSGGALIRWLRGDNLRMELGYVSTFNNSNTPGPWNDWLLAKGLYAKTSYKF